jgi:hypothetical protein
MKKIAALSFIIALAMMLLPIAPQINAASVNHANWAKNGPGPAPPLTLGARLVQAASAKNGPGPAPPLTLGAGLVQAASAKNGPGPAPPRARSSSV